MQQDQFTHKINELHSSITELIAKNLSPVALKYRYSDVNLETKIKWKPFVLVLGNYSSGKSSLINEFLGFDVQNTGQAPTDDSFTVITGEDSSESDEGRQEDNVLYEKNGHSLFNDPKYPFSILKKHGDTLASHFKLKAVRSSKLKNLAIVDTPGMLDTTTEKDRGYNYQEVIGELASCADIVLVLFDAHKAGTLKEAHKSLRDTLPEKIFEDRIIYVLNRIDECTSLDDMIRVYGTLCWNLSQTTGRKDIPRILLTYSKEKNKDSKPPYEYLKHLKNQQEELKMAILKAPKKRLDHLANFFEDQSSYLKTLLRALLEFTKRKKRFYLKNIAVSSLFSSSLVFLSFYFINKNALSFSSPFFYSALLTSLGFSYLSFLFIKSFLFPKFMKKLKNNLDNLSAFHYQKDVDTWNKIKDNALFNIEENQERLSESALKKELHMIEESYRKSRTNIRTSLDDLNQFALETQFTSQTPNETEGHYV